MSGHCIKTIQFEKKEEFPGFMEKHAAWELLSPDLRCFCKLVCGKRPELARLPKECALK
jgi:hypothetical protein